MIKKADIALFFVILITGLAVSWFTLTSNTSGDKVVITLRGELYGTYYLSEDREIHVVQGDHTNHITIKDGTVSMYYSDCSNQVCVNTGAISHTKDSIVCLPNKVMVEIESERSGADVISG